jgi:hypothetical protein
MTTLIDGLNLKLCEILNGNNFDIHGHEIIFEKTGDLKYSSAYYINCNRKYIVDLSSVIVTVKEITIPDDDVIYRETPNDNIRIDEQDPDIKTPYQFEELIPNKKKELVKQ